MAIAADLVPIERPCPVDLDPALSDGSRRNWHCGHCDQRVHVLSSMTEVEARDFMAKNDGKKICVTYLERPDGTIRFREPPLVPLSALSPRRIALGLGLSAALAACTPTERTEPAPDAAVVRVQADAQPEAEAAPCETETKDDTKMSDLVERYKVDVVRDDALAKAEARAKADAEAEAKAQADAEAEAARFVPRPGGITARALPPITPPPSVMRRGGIGG